MYLYISSYIYDIYMIYIDIYRYILCIYIYGMGTDAVFMRQWP